MCVCVCVCAYLGCKLFLKQTLNTYVEKPAKSNGSTYRCVLRSSMCDNRYTNVAGAFTVNSNLSKEEELETIEKGAVLVVPLPTHSIHGWLN